MAPPAAISNDEESNADGFGGDSGLSELSVGMTSCTTSSWFPDAMSRSDSNISRVAKQLEDCKISLEDSTKAPSDCGSVRSLRCFLSSAGTSKGQARNVPKKDDGHDVCSGNGKNLLKVVDLPSYASWLMAYG